MNELSVICDKLDAIEMVRDDCGLFSNIKLDAEEAEIRKRIKEIENGDDYDNREPH